MTNGTTLANVKTRPADESLAVLAARVKAALQGEADAIRRSAEKAMETGRLLKKVWEILAPEHKWNAWLEELGISTQTASERIRIFDGWSSILPETRNKGVTACLEFLRNLKNGQTADDATTGIPSGELVAPGLAEKVPAATWRELEKQFAVDRDYERAAACRDKATAAQVAPDGCAAGWESESAPIPHVARNAGCVEWYTPVELLDAARTVLGRIDLDPASSEKAQERVKARRYFTVEEDGLTKPWKGTLFVNPPYAQPLVAQFCEKLAQHVEKGDVPAAVVVVNNSTETEWFYRMAHIASAICFPKGRVRFLDRDGNPGAPLQGQAVLYLGDDPRKFITEFAKFGFCVTPASRTINVRVIEASSEELTPVRAKVYTSES